MTSDELLEESRMLELLVAANDPPGSCLAVLLNNSATTLRSSTEENLQFLLRAAVDNLEVCSADVSVSCCTALKVFMADSIRNAVRAVEAGAIEAATDATGKHQARRL